MGYSHPKLAIDINIYICASHNAMYVCLFLFYELRDHWASNAYVCVSAFAVLRELLER